MLRLLLPQWGVHLVTRLLKALGYNLLGFQPVATSTYVHIIMPRGCMRLTRMGIGTSEVGKTLIPIELNVHFQYQWD